MESSVAAGIVDVPSEYIKKIKISLDSAVSYLINYVNIPSFSPIMENTSLLVLTFFF